MIDIALLGCGGSMPIPERFLSSLLIQYNGRKCLVDCGEGTQVSMKMLGWGFKTIDVICLTHFHGDHLFGLPGLLQTIGNSGRTDSLTLIGPTGLNTLFQDLKTLVPYLPYELICYENPNTYQFNHIEINSIELSHSSPCLGYSFVIKRQPRFDRSKAEKNEVPKILWSQLQKGQQMRYENKTYHPSMVLGEDRKGIKLSYMTDTRPIDAIVPFIEGSDLFICEGTYGDDEDLERAIQNFHMTFKEAATLAKEGKVSALVLTHFSPKLIEPALYLEHAKAVFAKTEIGYDRMIKTLNFNHSTLKVN